MRIKHIFTCIFSLLLVSNFSAQKTEEVKEKWSYKPNFMVGVDLLNLGISFFSDRQLYQGFVSSQLSENVHAVVEGGFDKNIYDKNGYDATASGPFLKIGGFYMLSKDRENPFNGFYAGGKLAGSFYNQEYAAIPIRGYGGSTATVAYPSSSQTSFWVEGTLGGRVQLFESNFYIDVTAQPRYLAYSSKQDDIVPVIIPGFGRGASKFTMGFAWNIAYKF